MKRLALFAKPPVEGRVKTRLSPSLPGRVVRALYEGMLRDALEAAARAQVDERFLYWAEAAGAFPTPTGFETRRQHGADLGERLRDAFDALLDHRNARAVIMGADCPDLDAAGLDDAMRALDTADAVIGPSSDGGYYLIGLRRPSPELFTDIDWSTDRVREQTYARAHAHDRTVATLRTLDDVDTPADLARWLATGVRHARTGATWRALEGLGLVPGAAH